MAATRERADRPTQIHGVTMEERAFDASGQRLPWGYKWPDDHPNARFQKSQPEEKGAFGKSSRRFGSSRATRTQTPAKKENPTIEGFEAALRFDSSRRNEDNQPVRSQQTTDTAPPPPSSAVVVKEPLQVMLYGFSPDFQYAAIDFYERISSGMICEDYSRDPPASQRRYYTSGVSSGGSIPRRSLTPAELALSSQYHGGRSWIVVTFDSHESGDRAVASSPHLLAGHWVYAEPYRGTGPPEDAPIPEIERDKSQAQDSLSALRPPPKSATLGASSASALVRRESASKQKQPLTLPRSYAAPAEQTFQEEDEEEDTFLEAAALDSTTASSATALPTSESPESQQQLRLRGNHANPPPSSTLTPSPDGSGSSTTLLSYPVLPGQTSKPSTTSTPPQSKSKSKPATFTHFPTVPRTVIKPAAEALMPQVTWWESTVTSLRKKGWIPGDMIGGEVPRRDDGAFDWEKASWYWRVWAWVDLMFGTEFCGLEGEAAGGLLVEGQGQVGVKRQ